MINIAEILKNVPKGTKLYCPLIGEVTFSEIDENIALPIIVEDCHGFEVTFTNDGKYCTNYKDSECMLFPSKENRDWSTFKVEPEFPTTYIECCKLLGINEDHQCNYGYCARILDSLQQLLICRDAWRKIDNNWKPNYKRDSFKYSICCVKDKINSDCSTFDSNVILTFRTAAIRDKFFETFRDLIEKCKELI